MEILIRSLGEDPAFSKILAAVDGGKCPALLSGTGDLPRAHAAAALRVLTGRPVIAVCADEGEAGRMASDLASLTGEEADVLAARDYVFYNAEGVSRETEQGRIKIMQELAGGTAKIVVSTPDALMQRTMPTAVLKSLVMELKSGGTCNPEDVIQVLVRGGYSRADQVEGRGQFAVRGGILDFFSPEYDDPVRCDFFGDEIDSIAFFDVSTQRRTEELDLAVIVPVQETPASAAEGGTDELIKRMEGYSKRVSRKKNINVNLVRTIEEDLDRIRNGRILPASDRYVDLLFEETTAVDYFPEDAVIVMCEPGRLADRAKNFILQMSEEITALAEKGILEGDTNRFAAGWDKVCGRLAEYPVVMMASFTTSNLPWPPRTMETMTVKQLPSYGASLDTAASDIRHYLNTGYSVVAVVRDSFRGVILREHLEKEGIECSEDYEMTCIPKQGRCSIARGNLSAGLEYPGIHLAVISEGQISQRYFRRKTKKRARTNRQKLESFSDLSPGDLVVHEQYGIGRFVGIVTREFDRVKKDYIKISYSGSDFLYIPATQLDLVSKYIGAAEGSEVKLSKLGGTDWVKAKSRAKGAVKDLAEELLKLQAERQKASGHAFSPDTPWQKEFEESFEYEETEDQLKAVREIKEDMEKPVPMDRLLCGDVGYGKTEVALRAVMKCVMDGKQAAILVPTTVLAQQHYATVMKRFSNFPVNIEVLSRFRTSAQIGRALRGIANGNVDIVIGTHKLLQKSVNFKNLGLLVVDEEQRFGVMHKEKLKEITRSVDVLTLSATPIPRTLNMALSGVRDMSTIEEPPSDRQPVQTYVMEHDWGILADAMHRELGRGGQVYYLHNRIETIDRTAAAVREIMGEASVAVAHGRMDEDDLNAVMESMVAGEIQILVCTTIIENGIDIPNVNTLIIEDADKLGLAQLHQIRGRVGRSSRRAYAYFTFQKDKILTEVAEKRLTAIREFTEFNSGFKIAMRDLEIRGAGNILGAEQSGHIMNVGYDMYLKLLDEAVREEKGEKVQEKLSCSADFLVNANIPAEYVESEEQRIDLYRRIANITSGSDADDMTEELIDRFGDPPSCVNNLIQIALLRSEAAGRGITELSQKEGKLFLTMASFDMEQISRLCSMSEYRNRVKIEAGSKPAISLRLRPGDRVLDTAETLVKNLGSLK